MSTSSDDPHVDPGPSNLALGPGQNGQFQVYPFFTGTDNACTEAIYLLPPAFSYGAAFQAFSIPCLYIGQSGQLPAPPAGNEDFAFAWAGPHAAPFTQANVSVEITIRAANAWMCAPAKRQILMANFTQFLLQVEALESTALVPGTARLIAARIADQLPAPLIETLFWRYGLSTGAYQGTLPYVDLHPGMRLRVDGAISQFVNPGAPQNSYVIGPRTHLQLGSTPTAAGARDICFDGLLGAIRAPTVEPPSPQPAGATAAAGAVDLDQTGGARPYWRLIYPTAVPSPEDPGDLSIAHNVTLLGAPTLQALETATRAYPKLEPGGNPANVYLAFLGRALPVPEIPVFVTVRDSTSMQWVAVGTTLAHLIEQFQSLPLNPQQTLLGANGFRRPTGSAPNEQITAPLTLTTSSSGSGPLAALRPEMFDLPLIAGDGVTLNV